MVICFSECLEFFASIASLHHLTQDVQRTNLRHMVGDPPTLPEYLYTQVVLNLAEPQIKQTLE